MLATVFYPTLAWNFSLARIFRRPTLVGQSRSACHRGRVPVRSRDVAAMHEAGVRAVVNTCEEYAGPVAEYEKYGIEQLRIPTTDFTHPRLEDVARAVEFVQQHVQAGETVYIHCKAGRARSATVALCWLMKYRGVTMEEGQAKLLESRPHVNRRLTERPVVQQFAESIALS